MTRADKYAAGLVAVAILATTPLEPARSAQFTCSSMNGTHAVTLTGTQTTSSTTPVDLTGATFTYTPGDRCLVVEVSGLVRAAAPNALRLKLVVTGDVSSPPFPASRDVYTQSTAFEGRTATFWVDLLEGDKTVKVQFMSANGSPVSLNKATVVFRYTPGT